MANNTLTVDMIAKEALAILKNNLGWMSKVHRGYEDEYKAQPNGYKIGETVSIRRPADFTVRTGATLATQDVTEGKIPLTVDTQKGVDWQYSSTEMTLDINEYSERVIKPAMINLSHDIANDVATTMYRGFYNWVGAPGQRINSFDDFGKGPERLDEMSVPMSDRCAMLSPNDHWGLLGSQTALYMQDVAKGAYRDARLGMLGGIDTYMSQVTPTHTVGAHAGTPLVNGAAQNVTYDTAKNTWSQSLITDGWSNSVTDLLKAGDVFTIAGVNMVNPKTKVTTGILQQFVVNADVDSDGSGNSTLSISPPIIASGVHQTVDAAPADNAAITVLGTASTAYKQNMAFHKNSTALAVVPMEMPPAAYGGSRQSIDGFSVRVIPIYDGANDISKWRTDVLYGKKVIDPRLATRMSGTA